MLDPFIEAWQLRDLLLKEDIRPREVAEFYLARIESANPKLGAYMTVTADRALADAARLEASRARAASMPLYGVAYSLKDLTPTLGIRTTLGSRNYADSATPVEFCSARPAPRSSADVRLPKADSARWRAIRGISTTTQAVRAAAPRRQSRPDLVHWRRAATVAARFADLLRTAAWWD